MERFYLEKPSLSRKNQILEYIEEMKKHESQIHGDGRLKKYKIAVSRINKVLDSYYNITNKVLEMQKEFDRGDF